MKKVIVVFSILVSSTLTWGQNENQKYKQLEFGFNFGINRSNLILENYSNFNGPIKNDKFGFDLGVLISYNPVKWLSILPQAEISFNNSNLEYYWTDVNGIQILPTTDKMFPVSLGFKTHFHFRLPKEKLSPYLIIGPSLRIDIENEENMTTTSFRSSPNFAIDFGVGLENQFKYFKMSPEIIYSYGLVNVNPLMGDIYYHKLSLILNFKD